MKTLGTAANNITVDILPPFCPRCERLISAIFAGVLSERGDGSEEAVFSCPNCLNFFIGLYRHRGGTVYHIYQNVLPRTPTGRSFKLIDLVSERFTEIYNQATASETYGLEDIAGSGYRKALEFLVKDYCIALKPEDSSTIRKKFLKNVIDDHLKDGKLQRAATLTAWLGNDEGHYERRWVDKDLTDLKALLNLTVAFVEEDIQLEQYFLSMKPDSPKRIHFRIFLIKSLQQPQ